MSMSFEDKIYTLRKTYSEARASDLPFFIPGLTFRRCDERFHPYHVDFYYEQGQFVRITNPTTESLAYQIINLTSAIPPTIFDSDRHPNETGPITSVEISGDNITVLKSTPPVPPSIEELMLDPFGDDVEDCSALLSTLPIVPMDEKLLVNHDDAYPSPYFLVLGNEYFLKKPRRNLEIKKHLLLCPGLTSTTAPASFRDINHGNVINLLGTNPSRTHPVFPKLSQFWALLSYPPTITNIKDWSLQVVQGIEEMHSKTVIHSSLHLSNILFDDKTKEVVICGLGAGGDGGGFAPETARVDDSNKSSVDRNVTVETDVYDLGGLIRGLIYCNNPFLRMMDWKVPRPFQEVVDFCMQEKKEDRPTLFEVRNMVERIADPAVGNDE